MSSKTTSRTHRDTTVIKSCRRVCSWHLCSVETQSADGCVSDTHSAGCVCVRHTLIWMCVMLFCLLGPPLTSRSPSSAVTHQTEPPARSLSSDRLIWTLQLLFTWIWPDRTSNTPTCPLNSWLSASKTHLFVVLVYQHRAATTDRLVVSCWIYCQISSPKTSSWALGNTDRPFSPFSDR